MDPAHLQILHQDGGREMARNVSDTTRGRTDEVAEFTFYEVPYGIMKRRTYKNGLLDEHPALVGLVAVVTLPRVLSVFIKPDTVYPLYGFRHSVHRMIAGLGRLKFFPLVFGDSSSSSS